MGLGKLGLAALPAIETAIVSSDSEQRLMAVYLAFDLVEDFGDERCLEIVRKAVDDADAQVSTEAKQCLFELGLLST